MLIIKVERRAVERSASRRALSFSEEFLICEIGLSLDEVVVVLSVVVVWCMMKKG